MLLANTPPSLPSTCSACTYNTLSSSMVTRNPKCWSMVMPQYNMSTSHLKHFVCISCTTPTMWCKLDLLSVPHWPHSIQIWYLCFFIDRMQQVRYIISFMVYTPKWPISERITYTFNDVILVSLWNFGVIMLIPRHGGQWEDHNQVHLLYINQKGSEEIFS